MSGDKVLHEIWPKAGRVARLLTGYILLIGIVLVGVFSLEPGDRMKYGTLNEESLVVCRTLGLLVGIVVASQIYFLLRNWFSQLAIIFTEDAIGYKSIRFKIVVPFEDVKEIRIHTALRMLKGDMVTDIRCIDKTGISVGPSQSTLGADQDTQTILEFLENIRKKHPHIVVKQKAVVF
jgi:hypothetical protein